MQIPLQISFRDISHSDAVEKRIREKVRKLEKFTDRIMSCRVTVEAPHRHNLRGKLYHVGIDLILPGQKLVVARDQINHAHKDVYIAIRDAFEAVRRQLKKSLRQNRGKGRKKKLSKLEYRELISQPT